MRYAIGLIALVLLAVVAVAVRAELLQRHIRHSAEGRQERSEIAAQTTSLFTSGFAGLTVQRPPNPLSVFAAGLDDELTRPCTFTGWGPLGARVETLLRQGLREYNAPSYRYLLRLDLVTIVNIVCSLLAVLLTFDLVSGEQERGTLRLLLSGPLPRHIVITAKAASSLVSLLGPLVLTWAAAVLYATWVASVDFTPVQFAQVGVLLVVSALYVSFWCALGTAVSCSVRDSSSSLGIGLLLWLLLVPVLPNVLPPIISRALPAPSEAKMLGMKDALRAELQDKEMARIRTERARAANAGGKVITGWLGVNQQVRFVYYRAYSSLDRFFVSKLARQVRINMSVSRLSPSASFTYAATNAAGTGPADYIRHIDDLLTCREEYYRAREDLLTRWMDAYGDDFRSYGSYGTVRWPSLRPPPADLSRTLASCGLDLVLLTAATVLALLVAYLMFVLRPVD